MIIKVMQFTLNELKSYNYVQYQMNSNECEVMALHAHIQVFCTAKEGEFKK